MTKALPRILLVVDGYYPTVGGTELQVELLAEAFQARGHEVEVLTPWLFLDRPGVEMIRGVKTTRISYPRIRGLGAIVLMLKFFWWIWRNRHRYDAIHVHMVKNLASVMGMARPFLRGKVMVAKISGAWEFEGGLLDAGLRDRFPWSLMNYFVRKLDYFQAISQHTADRLRDAGYPEEKIKMIRNGLPINAFYEAAQARQNHAQARVVIGYAGRLEPVKGVDVLMAACGELARRGVSDFGLMIAGGGEQEENLKAQAHAAGIDSQVEFLGRIADMPGFMAAIDIYVQPSRQEGLPNSVMQAMAAGLPVVGTAVSGNVDLIVPEHNGLLSSPDDAAGMADNLERLIRDAALRARFGKMSHEAIQGSYALETVLDQLTTLYSEKLEAAPE